MLPHHMRHTLKGSASTSHEAHIERLNKRIEAGDAVAMYALGCSYSAGDRVPQDFNKALELWHQSANLSCIKSHCNIGNVYYWGRRQKGHQ
ncbi:hypothetical protein ACHAXR_000273 [Thalassiosira sp. AJA248-18]